MKTFRHYLAYSLISLGFLVFLVAAGGEAADHVRTAAYITAKTIGIASGIGMLLLGVLVDPSIIAEIKKGEEEEI